MGPPLSKGESVLIVGGGPTGLTLGIALAAYGIPFVIIDRKTGPTRDSKALAVAVSSQYGLELLGQREMLARSPSRPSRIVIYWQGARLTAVDFRHLDFHLRSFITQPQADTETALVECLATYGRCVQWTTRLVGISQTDDGVCATLQTGSDPPAERRFAFAVGCEGKSSLVREAMGARLSGHDYPMYFVIGDFLLTWPHPRSQAYYFVYEETFFIIIPLGDRYWRVVVKHDGPLPETTAADASEIVSVVESYVGKGLFLGPPIWISRAPFYMRICDRLRYGRLFLAGDSAHLYSPIGGTGMNTGMQDALSLGWRLAYALSGWGTATLLDSYEAERLPVIRATAAATDHSTRLISRMERGPASIEPLLPKMKNRKALRSVLPLAHSGLGLFSPTPLGTALPPQSQDPRVGTLCTVMTEVKRLLQQPLSEPAKLTLIVRCAGSLSDHGAVARKLGWLQHRFGPVLAVVILVDPLTRQDDAPLQPCTVSADATLVRRLRIEGDQYLLVLPNGIIARSGNTSGLSDLEDDVLARLLVQTPGRASAKSDALRAETVQLSTTTLTTT